MAMTHMNWAAIYSALMSAKPARSAAGQHPQPTSNPAAEWNPSWADLGAGGQSGVVDAHGLMEPTCMKCSQK